MSIGLESMRQVSQIGALMSEAYEDFTGLSVAYDVIKRYSLNWALCFEAYNKRQLARARFDLAGCFSALQSQVRELIATPLSSPWIHRRTSPDALEVS